jgi:hypothetical protein
VLCKNAFAGCWIGFHREAREGHGAPDCRAVPKIRSDSATLRGPRFCVSGPPADTDAWWGVRNWRRLAFFLAIAGKGSLLGEAPSYLSSHINRQVNVTSQAVRTVHSKISKRGSGSGFCLHPIACTAAAAANFFASCLEEAWPLNSFSPSIRSSETIALKSCFGCSWMHSIE